MTEARGAAFFDLDKTLMEGASGLYFVRAAYRSGLVSRSRLLRDVYENLRFRVAGATDAQAEQVKERVSGAMVGLPRRRLARLTPDVLAGVLPAIYPQMLEEAWSHQDAGRPVFIVTAASADLASLLAEVLTFDGGIGTPYEVIDDHYTGRLEGPFNYGEGKAVAIRALAAERGFDLTASYAYSDSASDLPMMRVVGHPVAVNPDAPLSKVAREERWQVMRFDKLGRRLKIAGAVGGLSALGAGGGYVAGRLRAYRSASRPRRAPPGRR